jgi:cell division protein FtsN
MAKDYGMRRSARRSNGASNQVLTLGITFLLGYASASIVDFKTLSHWFNTQMLATHQATKQVSTATEASHPQLPPKPKFEFYTLLANEKSPSNVTHSNSKSTPEPISKAPPQTLTASNETQNTMKSHGETPGNSNQVAQTKAKEEKPQVATAVKKGNYLVQVASFKVRKEAERLQSTLILKGFDVHVVPVSWPQGNWFRVVVGPFPSLVLAQKVQMTLDKTEHIKGMVRAAG